MPNDGAGPALQQALAAAGLALEVEAHEGLALLRSTGATRAQLDAHARRRVQELARQHGFTHAALELLTPAGSCDSSSP